jgi:hypothetical protein
MDRTAFNELNRRHRVRSARSFTSDRFQRAHGINRQIGLCAAFVQVWWLGLRQGNDGLAPLLNPTPAVIREILSRQARSFYFPELPASDNSLSAEHASWFKFKYGDLTVHEIHALCQKYGVKEILELDLILHHEAPIVGRHVFTRYSPKIAEDLTCESNPGLRLMLLRYATPSRLSRQSGHRMGLVLSSGDSCRFFDPNCGEMRFERVCDFRDWFPDFWKESGYQQLIEQPFQAIPPISVYHFGDGTPISASQGSSD